MVDGKMGPQSLHLALTEVVQDALILNTARERDGPSEASALLVLAEGELFERLILAPQRTVTARTHSWFSRNSFFLKDVFRLYWLALQGTWTNATTNSKHSAKQECRSSNCLAPF